MISRPGIRLIAAVLICLAPFCAYAAGSLFAGPPSEPVFTVIAPRLLAGLFPEQRLDGVAVGDGSAALEHVAADPTSIGTQMHIQAAFRSSAALHFGSTVVDPLIL